MMRICSRLLGSRRASASSKSAKGPKPARRKTTNVAAPPPSPIRQPFPDLLGTAASAAGKLAPLREAYKATLAREVPDAAPLPDEHPWIDDTLEARIAHHDAVHSAAYRELHRKHLSNAEMGLFGGEPGFERSPRVFVDPDRPHLKHVYTQSLLNANLRYARYGEFKRELPLLDVDKLVRHARILPSADKLLTDFIANRVALSDHNAAAIIRHLRTAVENMTPGDRATQWHRAEELFERMLITSIPPIEVGTMCHAEMLRICAVFGLWREGYVMYHGRFMELLSTEAQRQGDPAGGQRRAGGVTGVTRTSLVRFSSDYADALMELCYRCGPGHLQEAAECLLTLLRLNVRPLPQTLSRYLQILQINHPAEAPQTAAGRGEAAQPPQQLASCEGGEWRGHADEVWRLFHYFALPLDAAIVREYIALCALEHDATGALQCLAQADVAEVKVDERTFSWLLFALRRQRGAGPVVRDLLAQLPRRGLIATYEAFTFALMHCALCGDGALAEAIVDVDLPASGGVNWTPEMAVMCLQAFATGAAPGRALLEKAIAIINAVERSGPSVDLWPLMLANFFALCAAAGAAGPGLTMLKRMPSLGVRLTTQMANALLFAVAADATHSGCAGAAVEVLALFPLAALQPTRLTAAAVQQCIARFGASDPSDEALLQAAARRAGVSSHGMEGPRGTKGRPRASREAGGVVLADDTALPQLEFSPLQLRRLTSEIRITKAEMQLKRHGTGFGASTEKLPHGATRRKVEPFSKYDALTFKEVPATGSL